MYISLRRHPPGLSDPAPAGRRAAVSGTVVLLGLTSMFTDASAEMVVAVLPLFATAHLALSPLAYGVVDGIYQGVTALVRVAGGFTSDRTRRPKAVAAAGYGLSAACKLALLTVGSGAALAAVVAADRAGKGIRTAPRDALVTLSSHPSALGRSFGVHRSLDTLGALAGPLLAFALLAAVPGGYDTVFVVSFAIALVGMAVLVFMVPDLRPPARKARPALRDLIGLANRPGMRRLLLLAGMLSAVTIGDGFLYLALQRREEFTLAWFPLLFVGTAVVYLLLAVPVGRLADRFGRVRVFLAGHVPLIAAYLLASGYAGGVATVLACLMCLGIYYAATDGVLAAATAALLPKHLLGSGLAIVATTVAVGRLLAAVLFGAAWTFGGRDGALLVLTAALCVALIVGVLVRHRVVRP